MSFKQSPTNIAFTNDHEANTDMTKQSIPEIDAPSEGDFSYVPDPNTVNMDDIVSFEDEATNLPMDLDWVNIPALLISHKKARHHAQSLRLTQQKDAMDSTFQINTLSQPEDIWNINDSLDLSFVR